MNTINLVLCNKKIDPNLPYFYIGRPSIFGNPFFPLKGNTLKERDRVCDEYGTYFTESIIKFSDTINQLLAMAIEGGALQLICFCAPLRCHGNTIIQHLADALFKEGYDVIISEKY